MKIYLQRYKEVTKMDKASGMYEDIGAPAGGDGQDEVYESMQHPQNGY